MREWKIGDPMGDGNDIGVPDIRYMDYLKDDEYETEKLEDFRFFYGEFHREFETENFDTSFSHLNRAFKIYQKLSIRERRQLSDNPFNHRYAVELYSLIYNLWDERRNDVIKIINKQEIPIVVCDNCKNIYPTHYTYCVNCGESLEKSQNEKNTL